MGTLVYVFDDEESICELMRIVLEGRNYEVGTATDGDKSLKMLLHKKPDIAIIDIKMPRLNGFELISRMKENPDLAQVPIIVITSLTSDSRRSDKEWKERLEVQDFISKPFEPLELVERIEKVLGSQKTSQ